MTPNPAKKSFEEKFAALVERKAWEFSPNESESYASSERFGFTTAMENTDLLRAVRLDERIKILKSAMDYAPRLVFRVSVLDAEAELKALLSGGGENG